MEEKKLSKQDRDFNVDHAPTAEDAVKYDHDEPEDIHPDLAHRGMRRNHERLIQM